MQIRNSKGSYLIPLDASARLSALRALLKGRQIDGFVIPRTDEYQGENIAAYAQRLAWLTGFTGSAGTAIVLPDKAALFVDGRYTLQAAQQVDSSLYTIQRLPSSSTHAWLKEHLKEGQRISFDPWLHTSAGLERLRKACETKGATLVEMTPNPIDLLWHDQPARPQGPILPHPLAYTGESANHKIARISAMLPERNIDAAIITALDSIAWLTNIRGEDISYAPLVLAFALVKSDGQTLLFLDDLRLTAELAEAFKERQMIQPAPLSSFEKTLQDLGKKGARVLIDPALTPARLVTILQSAGACLVEEDDPCLLLKACRNAIEIDGMRQAHIRDGVAMVNFLSWLDETWSRKTVTEVSAAEKLLAYRSEQEHFRGLSFPTISATGPHGAIIHYHPTAETNSELETGHLYLVDSGGQYLDGTTDITRTLILGSPSAMQCEHFTRVLKGHIDLAKAVFPKGTTGSQLDALARAPLWQIGADYDHGTGHGVGSYLCVHEGPQRIGSYGRDSVALQPGMILSNEPGYYKEGAYGIRLESLVVVQEAQIPQAERPMLRFETLTMVPLCLELVDTQLLNADEIQWLNAYHRTVYDTLHPCLQENVRAWLSHACRLLATTG